MKETIDKAMAWIKGNTTMAIVGAIVVTLLFFPKLFSRTTRRRRYRAASGRYLPRAVRYYRAASGRRLPRAAGRPRKPYSKGGRSKKPWQIKGSLAARRHMAQIRRRRRA